MNYFTYDLIYKIEVSHNKVIFIKICLRKYMSLKWYKVFDEKENFLVLVQFSV